MNENNPITIHVGFDLPLPPGAPKTKTRAATEAFIQRLGDVSVNRARGSRIYSYELTDFFVNLVNDDDATGCILELLSSLNRAANEGTTHIRRVRDKKGQTAFFEGVDLPILKELFPVRTALSLS